MTVAAADRTRLYRDGALAAEGFPAAELAQRLADDPEAYAWLDLCDPSPEDLAAVAGPLRLHPLAVEDALTGTQRPKLDRYDGHLFLHVAAVQLDAAVRSASTTGLSAFVLARVLVTVRPAAFDVAAPTERWDRAPELARSGVGSLVHGLLDLVVDGHYDAVDAIESQLDDLQDDLFEPRPGIDARRRGLELRRALVTVRRAVQPMEELLDRLLRSGSRLVSGELGPYYQDVRDHVLHAVDGLEAAREDLASVLDSALTEQGNELNVITRKLAAWAAIIAVPTAVTGFYGQNVPYPGFSQHGGFWVSTVVIVGLSLSLYLGLRRRGWL